MDKREGKMVDKWVEDAKGNMQVDKQEERMVDKQEDKMADKQEDKMEDKERTGWTRLMSVMNVEKTAVHRQEPAGRSKLSGKVGMKMRKVENFFLQNRDSHGKDGGRMGESL